MNVLNGFILILAAYLAIFVTASPSGLSRWIGVQIDPLPSLMVYCALSFGWVMAAALPIVVGLWFDSMSANPLGISILPLFTVIFLIHLNRELILREQRYAQFVLGLIASALVPVLTLAILIATGNKPHLRWDLLWQWAIAAGLGGLITPVCFWFFDHLRLIFNYQPLPETSFRQDREIKRGRR